MTSTADRRSFLQLLALSGASALGCSRREPTAELVDAAGSPYQEKSADLIVRTERPPNLEMPARWLVHDLTPSAAMFVRWHLSVLPTSVDERTYRLRVGGHVTKPVELSLDDLKRRFENVSIVAVNQCSGNSRALFAPRVPGVQWERGAVGNARWTGVRLKDVLGLAGVRDGAVEVAFGGLDSGPADSVPDYEKSLEVARAREPDVLLAWGMNDAPLPMLNGFPLRLVVPGWFSTYWVKALETVTVLDHPLESYWMKRAYRIPAGGDANEAPGALAKDTIPIREMVVRSLIAAPPAGARLSVGAACEVQGVAWDSGSGVARVEVSTDGGATWTEAALDKDLGPYSWRRFRYRWTPSARGPASVLARATSARGEMQRGAPRWNRSGYLKNDPDRVAVEVA